MRKWYPLEADAAGEHKSSNIHGELELILEWCYNPALDFDPFCEEDKYPEKAPNEVCVGLGRGRHLAIKDKAVLYGEGSSDPRCTLRIDGTELKEVSQVKKTTLNPIWNETFAFPYSRGPDDSQPPELLIECEDVDTVSAADFMGLVRVELDPLKDHKRLKKWLPLQAKSDDKASSNISGDLEVFVRWRYNPELDFDPYPDSELKPAYKDKEPNELRLALVQARGLAIKDKNLLSKGGLCFCVLVVPSTRYHERRRRVVSPHAIDATLFPELRMLDWRACSTSTPSPRYHPGRRQHIIRRRLLGPLRQIRGDRRRLRGEALQIQNQVQDALPALERVVSSTFEEGRGPTSIGSATVRRR